MAQPVWQTAAGSLGVIREGVFFQLALVATVPPDPVPIQCTATTAGTNLITCDSTATLAVGRAILFIGVPFGGIRVNTTYIISSIANSTQFTICENGMTQSVILSTATGVLTGLTSDPVYYKMQAGTTPIGIEVNTLGVCFGVPLPGSTVGGIPALVAADVTSKFTIRAYTKTAAGTVDRFVDRTFALTITGNNIPQWVTPAGNIGNYYDSDLVDIQLQYTNDDPGEDTTVRLVAGTLPLGLKLSSAGRITGYVRPAPDETQTVGYDLQPYMTAPYDFVTAAISRNYQFTLELFDGKTTNQRTFTIFVYDKEDLVADDDLITGDNTFITADETTASAPFLLNYEPQDLGTVQDDNHFAYRFIGDDYNGSSIEYALSVNQGYGTPPGLTLDPYSGWYYGDIPVMGPLELTYSFNIQVRARSLVISATTAGTNIITCDSNTRGDFYVGGTVRFEGAVIGGLATDTTYYVKTIISDTEFTVSLTLTGPAVALSTATASGLLLCVPDASPRSQQYPFTLTVSGNADRQVTWLTNSDLGVIENGSISLLRVEAVSRAGLPLLYQLEPGGYNSLPQGLTLLPTGEIAGRVSFDTFSLDGGATTIDSTTTNILRLEDTSFDATHTFTVNAYATDDQVPLYEVNSVRVLDGGSGYVTAPTLEFNQPVGASAVQATANAVVGAGAITGVLVIDHGAEYTGVATYALTGTGVGANLEVVMQQTGYRRIVSVFKTFSVRVVRAYDKPYQNLDCVALPPANDRELLAELLTNNEIFVPDYIFRPTDPNFGVSTAIRYQHAFGLAPDTLENYVASLYLNHYRKNLILGSIKTAQARDANDNIIYEVIYSQVVDDLVNAAGNSVRKIVTTPYAVANPEPPPELINSVYPNSLINMRDQVIDVVGQTSTKLPLWMTSRQSDGRILGFTPAWVICYTKPGRSQQVAYYLNRYFGQQLNLIDFQVDRYVLDSTLSLYWDTTTQSWNPPAEQTTFDRINITGYTDLGTVNVCTQLPFIDVNGRTLSEINALGGLDGSTWISALGPTPPGTKVVVKNGSRIIFVKQENFGNGLTDNQAFQYNQTYFGGNGYDIGLGTCTPGSFDYGPTLTGGYTSTCNSTNAATDYITADSTVNMRVDDKVWFSGTVYGGIDDKDSQGQTQSYYVHEIDYVTGSTTASFTDRITVSSTAGLVVDEEIWMAPARYLSISETSSIDNSVNIGNNSQLLTDMKFVPVLDIGNLVGDTTYYIKSLIGNDKVTVSATPGGVEIDPGFSVGPVVVRVGGPIGNIADINSDGLAVRYYIAGVVGSEIYISTTPGGSTVPLSNDIGTFVIYRSRFSVALSTDAAAPVPLVDATGNMTVNYENLRMAIWTVVINDDTIYLSQPQETVSLDFVQSTQGQAFPTGTLMYRPETAQPGLNRVNWQPLISAAPVATAETTFDQNSVQWVEPIDMYDPTDRYDKYLVFPKVDILQ